MRRRAFLCGSVAVLAAPLGTEAQQAGKVARIGVLRHGSPPDPFMDAFRQGLQELGYAEGRNITIEYRWAKGRDELLPGLAAELVRLKMDVIVASGAVVMAVKQATTSVPVVMPVISDPVRLGLVASYARPGGNFTGLALQYDELPGKWIQLLKEAFPQLSRVAVLADSQGSPSQVRTSEVAARSLGAELQVLDVVGLDDFGPAFAAAQRNPAQALVVLGAPLFFTHRTRLVELAAKHRLPTMYHQREFVVGSGGLMSYGPDFQDLFRRAATYVDKILKGAKPGDLPIEQPTKFELVINLKTAKALGLRSPRRCWRARTR
jgi:putative ABC transport system substrate-binding protein